MSDQSFYSEAQPTMTTITSTVESFKRNTAHQHVSKDSVREHIKFQILKPFFNIFFEGKFFFFSNSIHICPWKSVNRKVWGHFKNNNGEGWLEKFFCCIWGGTSEELEGEEEIDEVLYVSPYMCKPDATDTENVVPEQPDMEWRCDSSRLGDRFKKAREAWRAAS